MDRFRKVRRKADPWPNAVAGREIAAALLKSLPNGAELRTAYLGPNIPPADGWRD